MRHGGARRLFDEVADAYRWWQQAGEPGVTDWTVTVRPDGHIRSIPRESGGVAMELVVVGEAKPTRDDHSR
ncbi:MAG: hypothetical protein ACRDXB_17230 [Actinomycetes bacterium]